MTDAAWSPDELLLRAEASDSRAIGELLTQHQERLVRLVAFRLDRRLATRIDASDVVQDASVEAISRLSEYLEQPAGERLPFYVWLRFLTMQRLAYLQRYHLGTQARNAGRDVALPAVHWPDGSSIELAGQLLGRLTSPTQAALRAELQQQMEKALCELENLDREIITLRHFEQLSNQECAAVLQLSPTATSNRYIRAIRRLKHKLDQLLPSNMSTQGDTR